jgi:hypothetical protein
LTAYLHHPQSFVACRRQALAQAQERLTREMNIRANERVLDVAKRNENSAWCYGAV